MQIKPITKDENLHVAIIGLGLMGGSFAKALKKANASARIATLQRECTDIKQALAEGLIDAVFERWDELLNWADIVLIATPLSTIVSVAEEIALHRENCGKNVIIMDVGSVKSEITSAFEKLSDERMEFVSTHPMAGKETWGFENSCDTLFEKASWIVVPHRKNKSETQKLVCALIESVGSKVVMREAKEHDEQTALISHLPAFISRALLGFISQENPHSIELAGPGFASMTRLAKDNPALVHQIMDANRENILAFWEKWIDYLKNKGPL